MGAGMGWAEMRRYCPHCGDSHESTTGGCPWQPRAVLDPPGGTAPVVTLNTDSAEKYVALERIAVALEAGVGELKRIADAMEKRPFRVDEMVFDPEEPAP